MENREVEVGDRYKICTTHIAGVVDTCFTVEVTDQAGIDMVQGYIKEQKNNPKRTKVTKVVDNEKGM